MRKPRPVRSSARHARNAKLAGIALTSSAILYFAAAAIMLML